MCPARKLNGPTTSELLLRRRAHIPELTALRHALTRWNLARGLSPRLTPDVELAAYEALANVYLHAYPAGATGDVELRAQHTPGTLWVDISDEGDWQPPRADCGPWRGRGLVLINQLAGQTAIASTASGTTVSLTWEFTQQ